MGALMRRGQARLEEGFLDLSKKDLKRAQKMDKNNSVIKKLLKICTVRHKKYVEKQQKLYSGMFGKKKNKKSKKKKKEDVKKVDDKKMDIDEKKDENVDQKEKEKVNDDETEPNL